MASESNIRKFHERFNTYSSEEQDFILQLGMSCFDNSKLIANQEKEDQYQKKIKEIRESHRRDLEYLREHEAELVDEKVKSRETFLENHYKKQIDYLTRHSETLCEKLKHVLVVGHEKSDRTLESLNSVINTVRGISSNSSERGKFGESVAEIELDKYLPSGTIWENTSAEAGKSDYHLDIPNIGKVLMDIKNHEKDHGGVPAKDRKKFLRDIDSDSTAIGGILVAISANIQSATHCQVIFSDKQKPMVACVLEGDWKRIKDAVEVLRLYSYITSKSEKESSVNVVCQSDSESGDRKGKEEGVSSMRTFEMCKEIMAGLIRQEANLYKQRDEIIRQMTAVNLMMSELHCGWKPSIREWLMLKLRPLEEGEILSKDERVNIKELREMKDAPKELGGKNGRDYIRDALHQNGISINTDGTITNSILRD